MPLRQVKAVRYVEPLREGGSMPGLVEADDGKLYVVKLRGAGQGTLALAAEVITGEIARALGLRVPEIVRIELDPLFGRQEHDQEVRDLLRASSGTNAGLAFLTAATSFDPAAGDAVDSLTASLVVWLDAYTLNVDRTARNPNLLLCHRELWLIDHGASLYFHHHWPGAEAKIATPFEAIRDHVLLDWAVDFDAALPLAHESLTPALLADIVANLPDDWLAEDVPAEAARRRYVDFLSRRLEASSMFEQEVRRARASAL
jgi:hypothetical protein